MNAQNNEKKTALVKAVEKGHTEAVQTLIEKGADLNAADNNGKTALNLAEDQRRTEMVELLKRRGAR